MQSEVINQRSELPPAQPTYILRGHVAQIHAVHFFRGNTRVLSGDAEGWVVVWDLPIRRPAAVWHAHKNTILGLTDWNQDKIITHGRDGELNVWRYLEADEATFSKVLPMDDIDDTRKAPWLLHSLKVHALNFCSFTTCSKPSAGNHAAEELIVAVPGLQDGSINLTELPSEKRLATIPPPKDIKTGMLMAVGLHMVEKDELPTVLAGYESGHVAVWRRAVQGTAWQTVYLEKAHAQPVMSLGVAHGLLCFFTSSADAIIARHSLQGTQSRLETFQTKHSGQQSLQVRSDERIFATAGWDGRMRVYSTKSVKELAVLKWHKEGCYACAFAEILSGDGDLSQQASNSALTNMTVAQRRLQVTASTHWLAAGSKDGKVSLWQIY